LQQVLVRCDQWLRWQAALPEPRKLRGSAGSPRKHASSVDRKLATVAQHIQALRKAATVAMKGRGE